MYKARRALNPVKIVAGFIFNDPKVFAEALPYLIRRFGPVDLESATFSFFHTRYYNEEMGENLKRRFASFKNLLKDAKDAYKLKLFTGRIEKIFSASGRRRINIDPGYLTLGKVVLLSTKDYSHRIYLKSGIYAETTLAFRQGSYKPWEWTYPDYKSKSYIDFFNSVRDRYYDKVKEHSRNRSL